MYDEFLLSEEFKEESDVVEEKKATDIDNLFENLTEDIANVNKYISEVTERRKNVEEERRELYEEKQKGTE